MMLISLFCFLIVASEDRLHADAVSRLEPDKLLAVRESIDSLKSQWQAVPRDSAYREHRANLHVHSHWSHDSRGTIDDIVAAAKRVGTSVLMFNEHPADHYDFFKDGHQGIKDGVLLIPGSEMKGFLAFPTISLKGVSFDKPQELADVVRGRGGQIFVSHLEERMDWQIQGITGVEIYNTHADFKDEKAMNIKLRNPLGFLQIAESIRKYPQETFSALRDYPADYLQKWDQLCEIAPHTGVSANDAHQNVGIQIRWIEDDKVRVEDALEKTVIELPKVAIPDHEKLSDGKKVGDILFRLILDPYENSLKHVGTHLLLTDHTEKAVREALDAGRAFVAFDWLADSTGFDFVGVQGDVKYPMGSRIPISKEIQIQSQAPLPSHWKLIRNGKSIHEADGRSFQFDVKDVGNYRIEAWLTIAGEPTIWILSNPLYVVAP